MSDLHTSKTKPMIRFVCQSCGKSLKVVEEFSGKRCKCPRCGQRVEIKVDATKQFPKLKTKDSCDTPKTTGIPRIPSEQKPAPTLDISCDTRDASIDLSTIHINQPDEELQRSGVQLRSFKMCPTCETVFDQFTPENNYCVSCNKELKAGWYSARWKKEQMVVALVLWGLTFFSALFFDPKAGFSPLKFPAIAFFVVALHYTVGCKFYGFPKWWDLELAKSTIVEKSRRFSARRLVTELGLALVMAGSFLGGHALYLAWN